MGTYTKRDNSRKQNLNISTYWYDLCHQNTMREHKKNCVHIQKEIIYESVIVHFYGSVAFAEVRICISPCVIPGIRAHESYFTNVCMIVYYV